MDPINLESPLSLKNSFLFPIQNKTARKEILIGGLLLLLPFIGWLLNMGHRIVFVHNMHHGREPFPAWRNWTTLLKHGFITWLGMVYYYTPFFFLVL